MVEKYDSHKKHVSYDYMTKVRTYLQTVVVMDSTFWRSMNKGVKLDIQLEHLLWHWKDFFMNYNVSLVFSSINVHMIHEDSKIHQMENKIFKNFKVFFAISM